MKKILINFIIFLLAPLCFLIYILKPLIYIRFGIIQSSRIGGFAIAPEIYLNQKKELSSRKFFIFDIISFELSICNKQLALLIARKISIFPYPKFVYLIIKSIKFWLPGNFHIIKFIGHPLQNYFMKNTNVLKFNNYDEKKVIKLLDKFGLKKDDKWVCIHNRDPVYLNSQFNKDWSYHNYRDYNISSMIETCNYFLSKDYFVIRIGKNAKDEISINHPNLIDYPFSNFKDDLIELYFMANSKFFIGSSSGPSMIPFVFRKPILLTNYTEPTLLNKLKHNNYLVTLKLFFDIEKNKILRINEIFERNLDNIYETSEFHRSKIKLIENSSDEILNASIELEKSVSNNEKENLLNFDLQKKFWELIDKYSKKNKYSSHNLIISPYFLKKYENILF